MSQVTKNIIRILKERKIDYKYYEHEPVYTSEQASKVRNVELKTGVKALLVKTKDNKFLLVLVRADKRADLKAVASLEGAKKLSLATPDEVLKIAGCKIGSVPPFGHKTQLKTYMDKEILDNEEVNFNIGERTISVNMKGKDLLNYPRLKPQGSN